MGRITRPFRTVLQEEMNNLRRGFRDALMDLSRRNTFDSLVKAWSGEQGARSYAKVPTVMDVMFLTAVVDNRRLIEDLSDQAEIMKSKIEKIKSYLERTM